MGKKVKPHKFPVSDDNITIELENGMVEMIQGITGQTRLDVLSMLVDLSTKPAERVMQKAQGYAFEKLIIPGTPLFVELKTTSNIKRKMWQHEKVEDNKITVTIELKRMTGGKTRRSKEDILRELMELEFQLWGMTQMRDDHIKDLVAHIDQTMQEVRTLQWGNDWPSPANINWSIDAEFLARAAEATNKHKVYILADLVDSAEKMFQYMCESKEKRCELKIRFKKVVADVAFNKRKDDVGVYVYEKNAPIGRRMTKGTHERLISLIMEKEILHD